MKKKLLVFCLSLLMGLFVVSFSPHPRSYAENLSQQNSEVLETASQNVDTFTISGTNENFSISFNDDSSSNLTWSDVLNFVDEKKSENLINLNFSDLNLSDFSLTFENFAATLSGNITSTGTSPMLKFDFTSTQTISLKNLTLSGECENLIEVSDSANSTIELEQNNSFSNTAKLKNSQAIKFNSFSSTLRLSNEITCDCEIFTNFDDGLNLIVSNQIISSKNLKITLPYSIENSHIIASSNFDNLSNSPIELVPNGEGFAIEQNIISGSSYFLDATVKLLLDYDENGGTIPLPYSDRFAFKAPLFKFLTETEIENENHDFVGWFGKLKISDELKSNYAIDQDYLYFDLELFEQFKETEFDFSQITSIFKTSLDEIENKSENSLKTYAFDPEKLNSETFLPFAFFIDCNQKISLVAKWVPKTFNVTFNFGFNFSPETIQKKFGETFSEDEIPKKTKDGYEFDGWFTDTARTQKYTFETMPANDLSLYAKWNKKSFTINFFVDDEPYSEQSFLFETTLTLPSPTKDGFEFSGWFEDNELSNPFNLRLMPSKNLSLYGKFTKIKYRITLHYYDGNENFKYVEHGDLLETPNRPTRAGFYFIGWFTDINFQNQYNFSDPVTRNFTIYARWGNEQFTVTLIFNNFDNPQMLQFYFGDDLLIPQPNPYKNHKFAGWFLDEELLTELNFKTMPAQNITLYAKWISKQTLPPLDLTVQAYDIDSFGSYKNFSDISGFKVSYFKDGIWSDEAPTAPGTYDVKIFRQEDENYAEFEQILKGCFVINYKKLNFNWLIASLFFAFAIEIFAIILIKRMKKMKTKIYATFPIIIGESILPTSQLVLIIISGSLTLIGFIYLIYLLVDLHRTAINEAFLPSKLDNRERFKDDLTFQNNNGGDSDYTTKVKTDESFGDKYSTTDIKHLLLEDDFNETIKAKRKKFEEKDDDDNFDESNSGSNVISKAKDMGDLKSGKLDNKPGVEFFEDDEK